MNDQDSPDTAPAPTPGPAAPDPASSDIWIFENSTPPRLGRLERPRGKYRVTFEDGTVTELDVLAKRWTEVKPTHFYFRVVRENEVLRSEFETDPVGVIVDLLEQRSPVALEKSGIQEVLVKYGVTTDDGFNAAWKKCLASIKKHPHVLAATDKKNAYRFTAEPQTPTDSVEDLIRELVAKATKPARKDSILQALIVMPLTPVEAAWCRAAVGEGPEDWSLLVDASVPPDAARVLVGLAGESDNRAAARFLAQQASNHLQPAIAKAASGALAGLPVDVVDSVRADLVAEWTATLAPGERDARALQRVRSRVTMFADSPAELVGPAFVAALLGLLNIVRDDQGDDTGALRDQIASAIACGTRPTIEAGAVAAADVAQVTKIGLAVRLFEWGPGSVRETVLKGLAAPEPDDEPLADPLIWRGLASTDLVRLLNDVELGPVLARKRLRTRFTDGEMERFVERGTASDVLALLGADGPLRACVPQARLVDRVAAIVSADEGLRRALDEIAGARWKDLLAERDQTIVELESAIGAAQQAVDDAASGEGHLRSRVGDLQVENENLRRTSGAQARFDALRSLGEVLVGLAIWSTHPDRLEPAEVLTHALQKAQSRGINLIGTPGEIVDFDSSIHQLLTGDHADRVTIVEPGVTIRDSGVVTTLQYAKVQPANEQGGIS